MKKNLLAGIIEVHVPTPSVIKEKIQKVRQSSAIKTTRVIQKGKNIIDQINEVKQNVQHNLGKFERDVEIIRDESRLKSYFDNIIKNNLVAVDTETTGLDPISCDIVGLCLYTPGEKSAYIPINHINYLTNNLLENQLNQHQIKCQLERILDSKLIFHNAKFDLKVIKNKLDIELTPYWDTMIGTRILNENEKSARLKYQYADKIDFSEDDSDYDDLFGDIGIQNIPVEIAGLYAAIDSFKTFKLYEYQLKEFNKVENRKVKNLFLNIEMKVCPVIAAMENLGIAIDNNFAEQLSTKYTTLLKEKEKIVYELIEQYQNQIDNYKINNPNHKLATPISITSPLQLSVLFYDILKCDNGNKERPRSTDEKSLKKINSPLSIALLDVREYNKLLSTYINKLPKVVNPITGRIHASFNQNGTETGRLSSSDPNLQNIPSNNKEIRKMFKATDGFYLIGSDFSQQEPRLLAHYSNDETLKKAYADKKDLYATIASNIYHLDYWACMEKWEDGTPNEEGYKRRKRMKSLVLAIMYGMGARTLAENLKTSTEEAQEIINQFYRSHPKVRIWIDETKENALKNGFVETLWGRKRRIPNLLLKPYEIKSTVENNNFNPFFEDISYNFNDESISKEEKYLKALQNARYFKDKQNIKAAAARDGIEIRDNNGYIAEALRQSVNARVQGGAADMSKRAMILIHNDQKMKDLGFRLMLAVHDELIGEAPIENAKEAGKRLSELMVLSAQPECSVPMKCDIEISECWMGDTIEL